MFIQTEITLAKILADEAPLPWNRALAIFEKLAKKLAQVHEQGRVAGNLHPAQIFFDNEGQLFIGALHGLDGWVPDESQRPLIYYQSPEQLVDEPPTPRSDQFALAVIFYEMIGGQLPFDADDEDWLRHIILNEPPALLPANIDAPPGIGSVLARALAKRPAERFEDIEAFSWAIKSLNSSSASSATTTRRAIPLRRPGLIASAVVMVSLVAIGIFLFGQKGMTHFSASPLTPSPPIAAIPIMETPSPTPTSTRDLGFMLTPQTGVTVVARKNAATATPSPTFSPTAIAIQIPTLAPTPTPTPVPKVQTLRKINLRQGPATTHPLVSQVDQGKMLTVLGQTPDGTWLMVDTSDGEAWVLASLVRVLGDDNDIPIVNHLPTPPPPPIAKIQPVVVAPAADAVIQGETTFVWRWSGPDIPSQYSFALRLWKDGEVEHKQVALAEQHDSITLNPLTLPVVQQGGSGRYLWSVVLIDKRTGRVTGAESIPFSIIIPESNPSPPQSDRNDHSDDNGGGNGGDGGGNSGGGGSRPPAPPPTPPGHG